jgi:hypothetical protein
MKRKLLFQTSAAALGLSMMAQPAVAHHGWSGQSSETFELTGTVHTAVNLAGPHATMRVQDKNGQIWDLTLAAGPRTEGAGLKEGVIPVGASVTVRGKRNRDPKRFEIKTERVTHAGKNYDVYPERS